MFFSIKEIELLEQLNNPEEAEFIILRSKDLKKNHKYNILEFFVMSTKYSKKVVVSLENNKKYFLPPRYCAIVRKMAKQPEEINCSGLYMTYLGRMQNSYRSPILKFIKEEEVEEEEEEGEDDMDDDDDAETMTTTTLADE